MSVLNKIFSVLPVKNADRHAYTISGGEYPLFNHQADCPTARYVGGVSRYLCECAAPESCQGVRRAKLAFAGVTMTAREYMAGDGRDSKRFQDYTAQFVTEAVIRIVVNGIGIKALAASTDPHLNDIPLAKWDRLGLAGDAAALIGLSNTFTYAPGTKETIISLADQVCVNKAAGRIIKTAIDQFGDLDGEGI